MVFVHGLGGDAFETWRRGKDESSSWPHWLGQGNPDLGVWSLGYPASPSKWTRSLGWSSPKRRDAGRAMAIQSRALQVLDLFTQHDIGERPILLIGHSLGGLLIKQILRKAHDSTYAAKRSVALNTRCVLFLATPHHGAALATKLAAFHAIFRTTVSVHDLRAHDAHLTDLYDWYRNQSVTAGIETVTYYESKETFGFVIVDPTSAHPGVGADPVQLDEDHLSIAKPSDPDAQVCGAALRLIEDHLLTSKPVSGSTSQFSVPWALPPLPAGERFLVRDAEPFVRVVDKLVKLLEVQEPRSRRLFEDFVEPLFREFEPLALDYQRFFVDCLEQYWDLHESSGPFTSARVAAKRIRSRRNEFLLARRKVEQLALALHDNVDDAEIKEFGRLIAAFFHATDANLYSSDSEHTADLFDMVAGWKLVLPVPEHLHCNRRPYMDVLEDFLSRASSRLCSEWRDIAAMYAHIRARLLVG